MTTKRRTWPEKIRAAERDVDRAIAARDRTYRDAQKKGKLSIREIAEASSASFPTIHRRLSGGDR